MYLGFQPQHRPPSDFLSPLTVYSSARLVCLVSYRRHLWDSKSSVVSFSAIPNSADSRGLPQFYIGMDCQAKRTATYVVVVCVVRSVVLRLAGFSPSRGQRLSDRHATHQSNLQANLAGRRAAPYRHVRLQPYPTQKPTHLTTHPRDLHAPEQPTHEHLSMLTSTTWFVTELSHNVQLSLKLG